MPFVKGFDAGSEWKLPESVCSIVWDVHLLICPGVDLELLLSSHLAKV